MSAPTTLLPFQPATMSTAQLAAVSYLACQLKQWFAWCEACALDPLPAPGPSKLPASTCAGTHAGYGVPSSTPTGHDRLDSVFGALLRFAA